MKAYQIALYFLACFFLLFGGIITGFWKRFFDAVLELELKLRNSSDSQSYDVWSSDSVPLYFNIRMFNWTNPELSLSKREKPKFVERGPYVFRVHQSKDHVEWHSNSTVSFRNRRRWNFVPERSNGSLTDEITNLNVVAVTFANFCKHNPKFAGLSGDIINSKVRSLYVTKSVRELLFEGYVDELMTLNKIFKDSLKGVVHDFDRFPDQFAWYWGKNLSQSEMFNMHTGTDDINKLGLIHTWNYSVNTGSYRSRCDKVNGSPGELWPMNICQQTEAPLFMSDLCSDFRLTNVGPKSVFGVDGVRFEGQANIFDNGSKHEEYKCYCPNDKCDLKSGVRNATHCLIAPAFISYPHFYAADEYYLNAIEGLHPDEEKHKFYVTLQKDSGLPLELFIRLQINILLEPHKEWGIFRDVPRIFVPGIWFEGTVEMPESLQNKLMTSFNTIPKCLVSVGLSMVILGVIFLVCEITISRRNKSARITQS